MSRSIRRQQQPWFTRRLQPFLAGRTSREILEISLALVAVIGYIDQLVQAELSLSVFYLFPIALATWYAPPPAGSVFCLLSTAVWVAVDINTPRPAAAYWLPAWNAAVRLVFFLVTTRILGLLKNSLRREKALSRTDSLTQVLNARGFEEAGEQVLQLAARYRHPAALAYIDLDNYKQVNDTCGHATGDRVLQDVASMMARCLRATDVVGRLGGDEFAILMPETGREGAQTAFAKIQAELIREAREKKYPIGFSIGVAVFPIAPKSLDDAINAADRLMYKVKTSGKNSLLFEVQGLPPPSPAQAGLDISAGI